jgi:hypothetical protein
MFVNLQGRLVSAALLKGGFAFARRVALRAR